LPTPTLNPSLASNRNKPISHQPTTRTATRGQCSMPIDHEHKTARLGSRSPGLSQRTSFDTQPVPNTYEHSQATMTWQLLHPHSCSDGISSRSYLIRASPALSAPMSLDHSPLHPAVPPSGVRQYAADRSWVSRQPLATFRGPGKINTHDPETHMFLGVFATA